VVGYALTGRYSKSVSTKYATTPAFSCAGASSVSVRFKRWLGIRSGDSARLQVSRDGAVWSNVWVSSGSLIDISWATVQYDVSAVAAGQSAVRLRWGLGSDANTTYSFGWNIDDLEVLADGAVVDTEAPAAKLSATDVAAGGSPTHQFTVAYTDDVAVAVATLGAGDIVVTGPGGFTNFASFAGVDEATDGSPRTATYSIAAPGGSWDAADNGLYSAMLQYGEVSDTAGNEAAEAPLGAFTVNILPRWTLVVSNSPPDWGSVSPPGGEFVQDSVVELTATPAEYFRFLDWSGAASGTNVQVQLAIASNSVVVARFGEVLTTNHPTPLWWLASFGVTGDFETAVVQTGANGLALWESYVAGLAPTNADSVLSIVVSVRADGLAVLVWPSVSGRVYTVSATTNLIEPFLPSPGAIRLPWSSNTHTAAAPAFFRIEVEKE
jgi:hypothetical protein